MFVVFSHILSSFSWDTRPPSKIISLEIWNNSLKRKNSLIVYKFHSLRTSASCSNLGIVPYFFPAPALKLLFQKKKSVLINSYIYIYYSQQLEFLLPFGWHTICEQVQNYLSCEPGSFFVNVFNSWTWNISESPIECTRGLSSLVLKFTLPTNENLDDKWAWQLW